MKNHIVTATAEITGVPAELILARDRADKRISRARHIARGLTLMETEPHRGRAASVAKQFRASEAQIANSVFVVGSLLRREPGFDVVLESVRARSRALADLQASQATEFTDAAPAPSQEAPWPAAHRCSA